MLMKLLLKPVVFLICTVSTTYTTATSISCGKDKYLCLGQRVLFQCNTTNPFIEWHIPPYNNNPCYELDFNGKDEVGDKEIKAGFLAVLVGKTHEKNASLSSELKFSQTLQYNDTTIQCFDGYSGEEKNCTAKMAGLPTEPSNVTLSKSSNNSLTVSWDTPLYSGGPGIPITGYTVTITPEPPCNQGHYTNGTCFPVTNSNITIPKLQCTTYSIAITSKNCVGFGLAYFTSINPGLPGEVSGINQTQDGDSILLEWIPPTDIADTENIFYIVSVVELSQNTKMSSQLLLFSNSSNISVFLDSGNYNISIYAVNGCGKGHPVYLLVTIPTIIKYYWYFFFLVIPLFLIVVVAVIVCYYCCKHTYFVNKQSSENESEKQRLTLENSWVQVPI